MKEQAQWIKKVPRFTAAVALGLSLQACSNDDKYCPETPLAELNSHIGELRRVRGPVVRIEDNKGPFFAAWIQQGEHGVEVHGMEPIPQIGTEFQVCGKVSQGIDKEGKPTREIVIIAENYFRR